MFCCLTSVLVRLGTLCPYTTRFRSSASAFETDRQLAKVGQPVDRDEWLMLPQTVNAYYHPGTNEICFPAAILQPPFLDRKSTRLNSSHLVISYAVFCLKKRKRKKMI